jgi:hypothetical protein
MEPKDKWRVDIFKHGGDWDWKIRDNQNITISPGRHIATVNKYLRDVEEVSNLIAAAPDLLEALEDLTCRIEDECKVEGNLSCEIDTARAALAKAKGLKGD